MRLRDMLDEDSVKIGLECFDKEECFEEMADLLVRSGRVQDREKVLEAVRRRESEGSTGIGSGIAVPHGKCEGLSGTVLALGISHDGIEFDAVDGRPVKVVLMILGSADEPGKHLQTLAEVVRLIRVPGFCERLENAPDAKTALDIIDDEE